MKLKSEEGQHILVYQTSDSNLKLLDLLKELDEEFIIYGFHKDEQDTNLTFKSFNDKEFLQDLATCRAVLTNGGFTLISEALYLKKPVLSVPVKKQFEQILNAIYLDRLGYGEYHEDLEKGDVLKFLKKLEIYRDNIEKNFQHDRNQGINEELDELIQKYGPTRK